MRFNKETKEQIFNEIKNAPVRESKMMELAQKYQTSVASIRMMFYQHTNHPTNNRKWNNDMLIDLCNHVKANPTNLFQAFRQFAKKYNKSVNSVRVYWYTNPNIPDCFEISSDKIITINRKNIFSNYE